MSRRSPERAEFLADVLTTAVEDGGSNGWRTVSAYRWYLDAERRSHPDVASNADTCARIHDCEDDEHAGYDITIDTIAHGIAVLKQGTHVHSTMLGRILAADAENDAGEIDSYDADAILQAGIFDRVIYG